jgi:hypothetical protein
MEVESLEPNIKQTNTSAKRLSIKLPWFIRKWLNSQIKKYGSLDKMIDAAIYEFMNEVQPSADEGFWNCSKTLSVDLLEKIDERIPSQFLSIRDAVFGILYWKIGKMGVKSSGKNT